jgi:DNA-binding NarL/FixJ family response regulator
MAIDLRTRVMLVDDHPLVRIGLAHLVAADPAFLVCAQAGGVGEVPALVREHDPDVLVLDLMLRDGSGLDLLKRLLVDVPHLNLLVLSMNDQRVYAQRCLDAGARGYLMKEEASDLVIAALRAVAGGGIFLSPSMPERDAAPNTVPVAALSDREMRVFELIGAGLPTRAIAARLDLSGKTVETHQANIKKKLGIEHAAELVRLAIAWSHTHERRAWSRWATGLPVVLAAGSLASRPTRRW